MRKSFSFISSIFFISFLLLNLAPVLAEETGVEKALDDMTETAREGFNKTTAELALESNLSVKIGMIVGAGLAFIGVIFFLLIIYGGVTWMIARGDEQKVVKAKDMITDATIGLVIVLAAYAITAYIGGALGQK